MTLLERMSSVFLGFNRHRGKRLGAGEVNPGGDPSGVASRGIRNQPQKKNWPKVTSVLRSLVAWSGSHFRQRRPAASGGMFGQSFGQSSQAFGASAPGFGFVHLSAGIVGVKSLLSTGFYDIFAKWKFWMLWMLS